jgi:sirohydrochlorin ferrochelatase
LLQRRRPVPAPLVLVAHGSADPRAAATTRALARAVAAVRPGIDVRPSYLDHAGPRPGEVLASLEAAGHPSAVLVPLLLTAAYHGRVDIPAVIADARAAGLGMAVQLADVLGPADGTVPDRLLAALCGRLAETRADFDGVVLAAAGTRDAVARLTVDRVADALGERLGVPCVVAYASAAPPTGAEAVASLRSLGCRRVAAASYFLACGQLYDTIAASALDGGAVVVAAPLGDSLDLAALVLQRARAALAPPAPAALAGR